VKFTALGGGPAVIRQAYLTGEIVQVELAPREEEE
jgi:hypothetical protein